MMLQLLAAGLAMLRKKRRRKWLLMEPECEY
jgi:hypothetical protein